MGIQPCQPGIPSFSNRPTSWPAVGLLAALVSLSLSAHAFGEEFTGRVIGVPDGDDVVVVHEKVSTDIRLKGIDCPEKGQPYGRRATEFSVRHAHGTQVTVHSFGLDKYGRTIGDVILPNGTVLNRELVRAGLCWWYRKYSDDQSLGELETEARKARRGLWADPFPIPPWDYRRNRLHQGTVSR